MKKLPKLKLPKLSEILFGLFEIIIEAFSELSD